MTIQILLTFLSLAACVAVLFYLTHFIGSLEKRLRDQTAAIQQELNSALSQVHVEMRHQGTLFQQAQVSVGERLEGATHMVGQVQNRLGQLEEANRRIIDLGNSLGKEVGNLQGILQAPKVRGGWGELFLGELLEQVLGPEHYELQYAFKNGERVDAVVKLGQGMVPVDAKFPLENFRKFLSAATEAEKKAFRKEFYKDVRYHMDQISEKYILPDEGTMDFALMYIPAENVYYETIIRDDDLGEGKSLSEYAQLRKVIPVSPNTLYVYLYSIARGLQGLKVESSAKEILANIQRLTGDLEKFDEEFRRMGVHLKNAVSSFEKAGRQFERIQDKFSVCDTIKLERPDESKALL